MTGDKRLRVVEVSEEWGLGGTEQAIELRARSLPRDRFDVLALGVLGGGPRLDRVRADGIPTVDCRGAWDSVGQTLRSFRPDIVHYARGAPQSAFALALQRVVKQAAIPLLIETNVFGRPPAGEQPRPPDAVAHMSLSSMLRFARSTRTTVTDLRARGHIAIYLPVPRALVDMARSMDRDETRRALGIAPGELLACRVARPDLRKWSVRLECALESTFERVPNLRFAFMAAPSHREQQLQKRFGARVLCIPATADAQRLATLYRASDLMIHSSGIGESFGLSVAEGMSVGLPIVVDSTPEVDNAQVEVVDHESTGVVVRSAAGFREAVVRCASDPSLRARLGSNGHEKATRRYAQDVVTAQWARLYSERAHAIGIGTASICATAPQVPAEEEYAAFDAEYQRRCMRVYGPDAGFGDVLQERWVRTKDTLRYARQLKLRATLDALRARAHSAIPWSRH